MNKNEPIKTEYRILAALSYLIWPVSLAIVLTNLKADRFLRFHGYQALYLGICSSVIYLVLGVFLQIIPFFGILLLKSLQVLWVFFVLYLAYRSWLGEFFSVPIIHDLAKGLME